MDVYLVGGAVRDKLLGRPVKEKDWVVVSGNPAVLEKQGYRQVGKSFPVFLHPETGEEYALARTETKTGPGYGGFEVYAGEDVTLEQDLQRRDLTINAIAETANGELIDPCNGRQDIDNRILRHVSAAFREDPLRVLRLARFAASLHDLGFSIDPATASLMKEMSASGELSALTPERVWQETEKAFRSARPDVYIATLRDCGALAEVFPEVDRLFGVPQPEQWHPEIDTGVHILLVLKMAAQLSDSIPVRFAGLVHDLGKGTTDPQYWPSHRGHEKRGLKLIEALCERLAIPNQCRDLALHVCRFHTDVHRAGQLRADTVLKILEATDAFRRPERFEQMLVACEADSRGRAGMESNDYPQADKFRAAYQAAAAVSNAAIKASGATGAAFGEALHSARILAISDLHLRDK